MFVRYFSEAKYKSNFQSAGEELEIRVTRNLVKLGIPEYFTRIAANSRKAYWFIAETTPVKRAISNERLIRAGYYDLSEAYEHIQSACIGRAVGRTVRTVR